MNVNINRDSLDNQARGTRVLNHSKSFQDRGMNRYKGRNSQITDNGDFRNARNFKIKNNYKSYDEQAALDRDTIKNNHDRSEHKTESFSYRCFNGDRMSKNIPHTNDRKPLLNSTINEYPRLGNQESKPNTVTDTLKPRDNNLDRERSGSTKSIKLKLNFLQESQLNVDKSSEVSSEHSKSDVTSLPASNSRQSLNPAAIEFTPSATTSALANVGNNIDTGIKYLSLAPDGGYVMTSGECGSDYGYQSAGKMDNGGLVLYQVQSPSMVPGRPVPIQSRLSYPACPPPGPHYQLAMYGGSGPAQMLRYGPGANYMLCLVNGALYQPPGASSSTSTSIAQHQYNQLSHGHIYPSYYTTDTIVNNNGPHSHIR